jgi:hypothetical protein
MVVNDNRIANDAVMVHRRDLNATLFARTATVVWDGRYVFNQLDVQTGGLQRCDRAFSTGPRPFDSHFDVSHAELRGLLSSLLGGALAGKRRAFSAALETRSPRRCPAERIALGVRYGDGRVIESRMDVNDAATYVTTDAFLLVGLCHREALIQICMRTEGISKWIESISQTGATVRQSEPVRS